LLDKLITADPSTPDETMLLLLSMERLAALTPRGQA
jgi:hypothetical protein